MPLIQPGAGGGLQKQEGRASGGAGGWASGSTPARSWQVGLSHRIPRISQEPLAGSSRGQEQELPEHGLTLGALSSQQGPARGAGKLRDQESEGKNYQPGTAPSVPGLFVSIFSNYPHDHHLVFTGENIRRRES